MKRICGMVLALTLLLALLPAASVSAAEEETILLAGSDFQVSAHNTARIEQVLSTLEMHGITKADGAFFCGDYALNPDYDNQGQSSAGLAVLKKLFTPIVGSKMTFVQGNHDPEDTAGLSKSGNNDPASGKYGVYVIHEDQYLQYDYAYSRDVVKETAANLKQYLDQKVNSGWTKPIFVLSHVGLHWGNRTLKEGSAVHGDLLVDVLNEAGQKGLNIIFLYGHDHSGGYGDFIGGSAVYFKKGDQMEVCLGTKKEHTTYTLNFTYMNAGFIGYYSTTEETADATVTMSVFRIRGDEVIITRYDAEINLNTGKYGIHNLKSKGVWNENWSEKGYHADPDTREYASSRKVTATDDVYVDTPMLDLSTMTTTVATTVTTTMGTGAVIVKTQSTTQKSTTGSVQAGGKTTTVTTTPVTTKSEGQTTKTTGRTSGSTVGLDSPTAAPEATDTTDGMVDSTDISDAEDATVSTEAVPTETETDTTVTETVDETPAEEEANIWILSPVGIALLVTGGVLIVAVPVGIVAFFVLRKKKEDGP